MEIDKDSIKRDFEETKRDLRENYESAARKVDELGDSLRGRVDSARRKSRDIPEDALS